MFVNIIIAIAAFGIVSGIYFHHDVQSISGALTMFNAVAPNLTIIFLALTIRELQKRV